MLVRDKFSFLDVDIWFDVTKCEFIVKNNSSNVFGVFVYFCGGRKNNVCL